MGQWGGIKMLNLRTFRIQLLLNRAHFTNDSNSRTSLNKGVRQGVAQTRLNTNLRNYDGALLFSSMAFHLHLMSAVLLQRE